jgi:hypothetical protein
VIDTLTLVAVYAGDSPSWRFPESPRVNPPDGGRNLSLTGWLLYDIVVKLHIEPPAFANPKEMDLPIHKYGARTSMKRTTIFLIPEHVKQLAVLGESTGLKPAHLVRIAIAEYIRRESRKQ